MVSPLRIRLLYWPVYAVCFTGALIFSWHFLRGHQSSEMRYLFPSIGVAFSQIAATWTCRFLGYSLERHVETRIEPRSGSFLQDEVEIRSYASIQIFKMLVCIWLGGAGMVVLLAPYLWPRGPGAFEDFCCVITLFLALAGFSSFVAWMGRRGRLVAKADADGVEVNMGLGEWRHLERAEVASATRIEVFDLFGDMVNSTIHLKDATGKVRATIGLSSTPPEQQQQFSQVVSRYLSPSASH